MSAPIPSPSDPLPPEAIADAAARWVVRLDEDASTETSTAFARWLEQDARHAAAYARLQRTRTALSQLAGLRQRPAVARLSRPAAASRRSRGWRLAFPLTLAAAAAVVVTLYFQGPAAAPSLQPGAPVFSSYSAADSSRQVTLPDGSSVELNAASQFEITFTATERRVRLLSGEAHFSVTKNPARPFIVVASGVSVRAVGTAFNVRLTPSAVDVLVTEGKVQVAHSPATPAPSAVNSAPGLTLVPVLEASQRVTISLHAATTSLPSASPVEHVAPTAVEAMLAWRTPTLVLREMPLAEAITHFNRRNRVQLILADPALGERPMSGNIRLDSPETFARVLETSGAIVVDRHAPDRLILRPKAP